MGVVKNLPSEEEPVRMLSGLTQDTAHTERPNGTGRTLPTNTKEDATMETKPRSYGDAQHVDKGHSYTPTIEPVSGVSNEDVTMLRQRNAAARKLLREWLADNPGYDEETWPILKQSLEANRSSSTRRLFSD